jgi:hypothetical protein
VHPVDLSWNLDRLGLAYVLGAPAGVEAIQAAEQRLGHRAPASFVKFYEVANGLRIAEPAVLVEPVEALAADDAGLVYFANVDDNRRLYLDPAAGPDGEWLVRAEDGYVVTRTLASFWANTLWHWLRHRRPIWRDWRTEEFGARPECAPSSVCSRLAAAEPGVVADTGPE